MKNERILIADDNSHILDGIRLVVEVYGMEDGHRVVAEAESVSEVEEVLQRGIKPTLAIIDGNFPQEGDGELAAKLVRKLSPQTYIVSFSTEHQTWGDENWIKSLDGNKLAQAITDLKH